MNLSKKIKDLLKDNQETCSNAYAMVDAKYRPFIKLLEQNIKVAPFGELTKEDKDNGAFSTASGIYLQIKIPYMTAGGRISMMVDEHKKNNAKYTIEHYPDYEKKIHETVITSDLLGEVTAKCKIGSDSVVDKTNPIENAETSSLARALGFMGYGLIGTGIASYEEAKQAISEQSKIVEVNEQTEKSTIKYMDKPKINIKPDDSNQSLIIEIQKIAGQNAITAKDLKKFWCEVLDIKETEAKGLMVLNVEQLKTIKEKLIERTTKTEK